MADNLTTQSSTLATIPASTKISTDEDATNGHVQRVKLAIATDGSSTHIPADAIDGLLVNLGSNNDVTQSGTWNITNVSGTVSLPTGAATAANQTTGNTALSAIQTAVETLDNAIAGTEMQVDIVSAPTLTVNAHAVTNAGTFVVQENGAALTALQLIDDAVFAEDVAAQAADKGIQVLAVRRDADTSLVGTDNDYAPLQVNANGALKVEIFDGGDSHTVDGTVTANLAAGTNNIGDVDIASIAAGDNNIGNVDIVTVPAPLSTTGGGTEATALRVTIASDSTGVLSIDDNGAAITVDGTVTAANTAGDIASGSADSGNPVKTGHKAKNFDGSAPGTPVDEDDRVDSIADVYGRQYVEPVHPNRWSVNGNYSAAQTDTSLKAQPGAGLRLYITDVVASVAGACNITLQDEDNTVVVPTMYFAANGGAALHFTTPIPMGANKALEIDSSAAVNHSILVNGYIAP